MLKLESIQELSPNGIQKSFYGKALVVETTTAMKTLRSYDTLMCSIVEYPNGKKVLVKYSDVTTNTTMRHVRAFLGYKIPLKEWKEIPVGMPFIIL